MPDSTDPANPRGAAPKLHIDSDWKAQAQAEKERLAQREAEREHDREARGGRGAEGEEFPPADFKALAGMLASQALMGLGAYGDEQGRMIVDLPGSRFAIDLLGVLEEKTKGNLTADEAKELTSMLAQLRSRFMQLATAVAQHMQARATEPAASGVAGRIDPLGGLAAGVPSMGTGASPNPGKKPTIELP
ncbi:MAG: DUF1844 domain-containing protein [Phycisphaerae bacterium]|jgi:hypothetical protein|nr:DUF1844 domain-containing protein [Phycisphaerae bacterium]